MSSYNLIRTVSHFFVDSVGNIILKSLRRDTTLIHKCNLARKKDNLGSIILEVKSKEQKVKIRYERRIRISYPNGSEQALWVDEGIIGGDTDGQINDTGRFANNLAMFSFRRNGGY